MFDASQYAFFGMAVMDEVELGGLKDNDNDHDGFSGIKDEYHFSPPGDREDFFPSGIQDVYEVRLLDVIYMLFEVTCNVGTQYIVSLVISFFFRRL